MLLSKCSYKENAYAYATNTCDVQKKDTLYYSMPAKKSLPPHSDENVDKTRTTIDNTSVPGEVRRAVGSWHASLPMVE